MGAIRRTLFTLTFGAVSPHSKKQRIALKTLTAVQGGDPAQVARAGTRREALGATGQRRGRSPAAQARVDAGMRRRADRRAARRRATGGGG